MTLPERLAREALPCGCYQECVEDCHPEKCPQHWIPYVEAAIRKAIEACMAIAEQHTRAGVDPSERASAAIILQRIALLRTEEPKP